jgi:hypothetical protein
VQSPIALKLAENPKLKPYIIEIDDLSSKILSLDVQSSGLTILQSPSALMINDANLLLVENTGVSVVQNGGLGEAILLVGCINTTADLSRVNEGVADMPNPDESLRNCGDEEFLAEARRLHPELSNIAENIVSGLRKNGVSGYLKRFRQGRWVNSPINSFTIKVQPKAQNIHFTLYGNPYSFDDREFLKQDQNSYSRGWVRGKEDVDRFLNVATQSYQRKKARLG